MMTETAVRSAALQRWLEGYCRRHPSVKSALVVLGTGEALTDTIGWPEAAVPNPALVVAARAAIKRAQALVLKPPVKSNSHAQGERILAQPLAAGLGSFGLIVQAGAETTDAQLLGDLAHAAVSLNVVLQGAAGPRRAGAEARVLQLQVPLLGHEGLEQAASALGSELAVTLSFDRVSLGLIEGGELQLVALSHGGELGPRQALARALIAAMQEAIDQGVSIAFPAPADSLPRIVQAHAVLAAQGPGSVLSVPLAHAGQWIGALCFERALPLRSGEPQVVEQTVAALAPLIALKQRAERAWLTRTRERAATWWAGRGRNRRLAWAAAAVAALAVLLFPLEYRVGAPAHLEGAVQRVLAAATDGYLHAAHVRPGDAVQAGQLLAELAQQDLQLQQRKWEAEFAQHENTAAAALARSERAQYALAQAKAAEARAQLELVQSELARTQLAAPIDGVVIKGDLSQSLGAPVKRGDVLLVLAPAEAFRLLIDVDETDVGAVALGQRGQLALAALPGERLAFTVTRISPVAVSQDGRNSFEVEAAFDNPPAGLRPGLQGVAKIEAGSATLGWLLTHRMVDWLRLALWAWTG
jgi:RND family efflux transporter MFP subunit